MDYLGKDRLSIIFELPLGEIVVDFYDKIKSLSRGYASFDYEFIGYRKTEIIKIDLLLNKKKIEAFSSHFSSKQKYTIEGFYNPKISFKTFQEIGETLTTAQRDSRNQINDIIKGGKL